MKSQKGGRSCLRRPKPPQWNRTRKYYTTTHTPNPTPSATLTTSASNSALTTIVGSEMYIKNYYINDHIAHWIKDLREEEVKEELRYYIKQNIIKRNMINEEILNMEIQQFPVLSLGIMDSNRHNETSQTTTITYEEQQHYGKEIGKCPKCKSAQVISDQTAWICNRFSNAHYKKLNTLSSGACDFHIRKIIAGHYIDESTALQLIQSHHTPTIHHFQTYQRLSMFVYIPKTFSAHLELDHNFKVRLRESKHSYNNNNHINNRRTNVGSNGGYVFLRFKWKKFLLAESTTV